MCLWVSVGVCGWLWVCVWVSVGVGLCVGVCGGICGYLWVCVCVGVCGWKRMNNHRFRESSSSGKAFPLLSLTSWSKHTSQRVMIWNGDTAQPWKGEWEWDTQRSHSLFAPLVTCNKIKMSCIPKNICYICSFWSFSQTTAQIRTCSFRLM